VSEVSSFVGTMYLPDGDIRPVHKVGNYSFVPPQWKCCVYWEQDDGKKIGYAFRYEHLRFTDQQLIEQMTKYVNKEWEVRYAKGGKPQS
jgi:hypothetical protein